MRKRPQVTKALAGPRRVQALSKLSSNPDLPEFRLMCVKEDHSASHPNRCTSISKSHRFQTMYPRFPAPIQKGTLLKDRFVKMPSSLQAANEEVNLTDSVLLQSTAVSRC